jgi:hypothetical protein
MDKYLSYINNEIAKFQPYELSDSDKKSLTTDKKAEWMTSKLLRKKFRKAKVHEDTQKDVLNKIILSIEKDTPIYLIICFGGYKHFWNPSYPEADWAEIFNLKFMSELVAPILAAHKPGVILDYESEDVILPMIDNFPPKDLDKYAESFREIISYFSKSVPDNFKINLVRSQEQCDSSEILKRVEAKIPKGKTEWKKLTEEEKKEKLHRSPKCVFWKGHEDLTKLSEHEKQERIELSKIANEIYYEVDFDFRGEYFEGGNHIPLVLSWGLSDENIGNWVTVGSTSASTVDFWTGRGILEDRGNKIVPRIISQNQYKEISKKLVVESTNDLFPLKNLGGIEIYPEKINF